MKVVVCYWSHLMLLCFSLIKAVVWRRFSQFLKLRKELVQIYHKTKGDVLDFPLFVKTNYFGLSAV